MNKDQKAQFQRIDDFVRWADKLMRNPKVKYNLADVRRLTRHKRAMERGIGDALLGDLTRNRLAIADELLAFFDDLKAEDETAAVWHVRKIISLNKKADVIAHEVVARIKGGV